MSNYTLFPDDDKKQVSGSAITATSTKIDGGSSIALGTAVPSGSAITAQLQLGGRLDVHGSQVVQSKNVFGAFTATPVALTSVADAGGANAGFCDFTLAGHGLVVGQVFSVSGSTSGNIDGVHKIIAVPDANSIVTDMPYVASATAGSYSLVAGRFASMTAGVYLIRGYSLVVAAGQVTMKTYGHQGTRRSIHKLEHMYSRLVATAIRAGYWNVFTGTFSTDPTVQDDASTWGSDNAANPTYAIPGELVYRTSGQQDGATGYGVTTDDYEAKTG